MDDIKTISDSAQSNSIISRNSAFRSHREEKKVIPRISSGQSLVEDSGSVEDEVAVKKKRKRVPLIQKSLTIVLSSLHGHQIIAECKNGTEISGIILEASESGLGMLLGAARAVSISGEVTEHKEYYLVGSAIRYVHLPPTVNAAKHLNKFIYEKEASLDLSNRPHVLVDKEKLRPSRG